MAVNTLHYRLKINPYIRDRVADFLSQIIYFANKTRDPFINRDKKYVLTRTLIANFPIGFSRGTLDGL
jgi:hypothetical protein